MTVPPPDYFIRLLVGRHMEDTERRSRAIGAGLGLGVGIGAGWGIVWAAATSSDLATGLVFGTGIGATVALLSGAVVYRQATAEDGSGDEGGG